VLVKLPSRCGIAMLSMQPDAENRCRLTAVGIAAGDKQVKAADAYVQPSLLSLRFKADWDQVPELSITLLLTRRGYCIIL
jgi:hypothetical protein